MRYFDKVVIVTGGSKGIGKGIVQVFVKNGATVVFCARGVEAGQSLEAELNGTGPGTCLFVPCDVTKDDDVKILLIRRSMRPQQRNSGILSTSTSSVTSSLQSWPSLTFDVARETSFTCPAWWLQSDRSTLFRTSRPSLSPGNVLTPLWEDLAAQSGNAAAAIKEGEESQLIGRMGTETECGLAALFLAADASYCTGVELLVSGGAELNLARKSQIS
ncbi:17-beta-hydroxysteroid dehydrogenase 14 isoform X2 [Conger conger]|uniref:17-beta-hydroxysteroid dehydrogenase 14 isoform X2 n=1 Tax=Conger conger TaxID=82655 RepID=UPI002A5A7262|nr:17-beta-hydroxysteroid dehydrogenase 14 isoform X2 [Conger conger]